MAIQISIASLHSNAASNVLTACVHPNQWRTFVEKFFDFGGLYSDLPPDHQHLFAQIDAQFGAGNNHINPTALDEKGAETLANLRLGATSEQFDMQNFTYNVQRLIDLSKQVSIAYASAETIELADSVELDAFDKASTHMTNRLEEIQNRQSFSVDASAQGDLFQGIFKRLKDGSGAFMPTGITAFDNVPNGGNRAQKIFGINGLFKSRKTTLYLNSVIEQMKFFMNEEDVTYRVLDSLNKSADFARLDYEEICRQINVANTKRNLYHIQTAIKLWSEGRPYTPKGLVFMSLENSAESVWANLLHMRAVDYVMGGKAIIRRLVRQNPKWEQKFTVHERYGLFCEKDTPYGDYDWASNLSADLTRDNIDFEEKWAIRATALQLAKEDIDKWGRRLRIYDGSAELGGVKSASSLVQCYNRDKRKFKDYPCVNLGVDYLQLVKITGDENEDVKRLANEIPYWAQSFKTAISIMIQRRGDVVSNDSDNGEVSLDTGARGGTAVSALLHSGVIAFGGNKPPKRSRDKKTIEEAAMFDPYSIFYKIWGGREIAPGQRIERLPIHPMTGRKLRVYNESGGMLNAVPVEMRMGYSSSEHKFD